MTNYDKNSCLCSEKSSNIQLVNNYAYKWFKKDDIYIKGYFIYNNVFYDEEKAIEMLQKIKTYDEFNSLLIELYGIFSIVIKRNDEIWAAVDRSRSFPLYFSPNISFISDNPGILREHLNIDKSDVNEKCLISVMSSLYLLFNDTMYNNILQLDFGQSIELDENKYSLNYYYQHIGKVQEISYDEAITKFHNVLDRTFDRMVTAIGSRPVILSLSGGYDSRYVAFMLKEKGINDVTCYTYGKHTSEDAINSKEIADKLGYKWYCIEYTDQLMKTLIDDEFYRYLDMSNKEDNATYLQNYLAFRELHKKGVFKPDSVVLTGLCGDMPSGNYIMKLDNYNLKDMTPHKMATTLYESLFHRYSMCEEFSNSIINQIEARINSFDLSVKDLQSYISIKDCIETGSSHGKVFLNMNCVHEFFGYKFLLPLWDNDFLDFWYSLPVKYRVEQNLYEDYILNILGKKYNISIAKKRGVTLSWEIRKKKLSTKLKYFVGSKYAKAMYKLGFAIKRSDDLNNLSVAAVDVYKKIKYKKIINYRKANFSSLCNLLIFEYRYGNEILKRVEKYIKEK